MLMNTEQVRSDGLFTLQHFSQNSWLSHELLNHSPSNDVNGYTYFSDWDIVLQNPQNAISSGSIQKAINNYNITSEDHKAL